MALQSTTALATVTLQAASSTVTFSGIPNTYRDLILVVSGTTPSIQNLQVRFNDSTIGYSEVAMLGFSSGTSSYTAAVNRLSQMALFTTQSQNIMQIIDYAQNKHKTVLIRTDNGGGSGYTSATAGRWANTDGITSISISPDSGSFNAGSTFSLFGRIA